MCLILNLEATKVNGKHEDMWASFNIGRSLLPSLRKTKAFFVKEKVHVLGILKEDHLCPIRCRQKEPISGVVITTLPLVSIAIVVHMLKKFFFDHNMFLQLRWNNVIKYFLRLYRSYGEVERKRCPTTKRPSQTT
jgi:hypothetical protein